MRIERLAKRLRTSFSRALPVVLGAGLCCTSAGKVFGQAHHPEKLEHIIFEDSQGKNYLLKEGPNLMRTGYCRDLRIKTVYTSYSDSSGLELSFSIRGGKAGAEAEIGDNCISNIDILRNGKIIGTSDIYYELDESIGTRTVDVSAAADEEFRDYYGEGMWQAGIYDYFRKVSEEYYNNFGIKFRVIELLAWESDDNLKECNSFFSAVERVQLFEGDMLVAFSGQDLNGCGGITDRFFSRETVNSMLQQGIITRYRSSRHILINDGSRVYGYPERCVLNAILHELGHGFGAGHSAEQLSIMNRANHCSEYSYWDGISRETIMKNKYRDFSD